LGKNELRPAHSLGFLVPYLGMGTPGLAKLSLATIFVLKFNLGTIENGKVSSTGDSQFKA
jgi:hypothetical protein